MPDSGVLRVQRHRRHVAGDHTLCRPGRCPAAGRVLDSLPQGEGIDAADLDPVVELRKSAARLISVCERDPANVMAAKELRAHLAVLPRVAAADPLDALAGKRLGWAPGGDPELRGLAMDLLGSDLLPVLRRWAEETP